MASFIYSFNYDYHYDELCKLESRQLFEQQQEKKLLFSDIEIDPSISPFIKSRFKILLTSEGYNGLIKKIKEEDIQAEGFKAEYLVLDGDTTEYTKRLKKLRDVGYSIEGEPDYDKPTIIYSICFYENLWYFGILTKHNPDWHKHKKKPQSFSNSISMNVAKTLVSIASKGNKHKNLLDACCGVGTILLEACCTGFTIEGCDINEKAVIHTQENLIHYNYSTIVHHSDIGELNRGYDAIIIDLPYNLYTQSTDETVLSIIQSSAKLATRLVIVSISDITPFIEQSGLETIDYTTVEKRGKSRFTRKIWVCEKHTR